MLPTEGSPTMWALTNNSEGSAFALVVGINEMLATFLGWHRYNRGKVLNDSWVDVWPCVLIGQCGANPLLG